jgi:membrane associated rhomboid family serine protease
VHVATHRQLLVFGYAGYLVARGYFTRQILAMLVALFVAGSYGLTMLLGLMPRYPRVSWQSHLGGALGGILAARRGPQCTTPMTKP